MLNVYLITKRPCALNAVVDQSKYLVTHTFGDNKLKILADWQQICQMMQDPYEDPIFKFIGIPEREFPLISARGIALSFMHQIYCVTKQIFKLGYIHIDMYIINDMDFIDDILCLIQEDRLHECIINTYKVNQMDSIVEKIGIYDLVKYDSFILFSKINISKDVLIFYSDMTSIQLQRPMLKDLE
jgi:hypothetical protein